MRLYWDTFADRMITEKDEFAPPERYIAYHCGEDLFIEKWYVGNNQYLEISYTEFDYENGLVGDIRKHLADRNNVKLSRLTEWTIPEKQYRKIQDNL